MYINTSQFTVLSEDKYPDRDSIYYESFWREILDYVRNGYSVGGQKITPYHFWYLNLWKIRGLDKKTGRKTIIRPRFTELDMERFAIFERMLAEEKDLLWVKGRQNGSSETMAAIIGYYFTNYGGSQSVIISGQSMYAENTMGNVIRGLNHLSDTPFFKRRNPDNKDFVQARYADVLQDQEGRKKREWKGILSQVYCLTAMNNAQAASRLSPSLICYEESGTWQKGLLHATRSFVDPSLKTEGVKTGHAVYIATGGEAGDSIDDVEEMFWEPDRFNLLTFDNSEYEDDYTMSRTAYFIPAWKFEKMDDEGNILKDESIASLEKQRKEKSGKDLLRFVTQKPFKPTEAFMVTGGGFFGEDIVSMLNERRSEIKKHRELRDIGGLAKLFWRLEDGSRVEWLGTRRERVISVDIEYSAEGNVMIYEEPYKDKEGVIPFGLYKGGTDSYDRDEAKTSKSVGSCYIKKSFVNLDQTYKKFVAEYNDRPTSADKFFETTAKLHMLYNALNLIEYSNLTIFQWYTINGFEYLLRERPYLAIAANIKNSTQVNKYGADPALKPYALNALKEYLSKKENVDKLESMSQIEAFIKYRIDPNYNCDITLASAWAELHEKEDETMMVHVPTEKKKDNDYIYFKTDRDGQLIMM